MTGPRPPRTTRRSASGSSSTASSRRTCGSSPALYRLRLLNASLFSAYDFALSDGRPFVQVGTGNGLLPTSVVRHDILLGPAQRADVVVDFRGRRDEDVLLSTIPRTDDARRHRLAGPRRSCSSGSAGRRTRARGCPTTCGRCRRSTSPSKVADDLDVRADQGPATARSGRSTARCSTPSASTTGCGMGTVERWRLRNTSDVTHYVHLHEEQWRTVSRNGKRPPPWERGFEDTWRLDPGETRRGRGDRFTDYPRRLHGALPHARPRGPRDDGPVRGAPHEGATMTERDLSAIEAERQRVRDTHCARPESGRSRRPGACTTPPSSAATSSGRSASAGGVSCGTSTLATSGSEADRANWSGAVLGPAPVKIVRSRPDRQPSSRGMTTTRTTSGRTNPPDTRPPQPQRNLFQGPSITHVTPGYWTLMKSRDPSATNADRRGPGRLMSSLFWPETTTTLELSP